MRKLELVEVEPVAQLSTRVPLECNLQRVLTASLEGQRVLAARVKETSDESETKALLLRSDAPPQPCL